MTRRIESNVIPIPFLAFGFGFVVTVLIRISPVSAVVLFFFRLLTRTVLSAAPYSVPFDFFPVNVIVNTYSSVSDCMGEVAQSHACRLF